MSPDSRCSLDLLRRQLTVHMLINRRATCPYIPLVNVEGKKCVVPELVNGVHPMA